MQSNAEIDRPTHIYLSATELKIKNRKGQGQEIRFKVYQIEVPSRSVNQMARKALTFSEK